MSDPIMDPKSMGYRVEYNSVHNRFPGTIAQKRQIARSSCCQWRKDPGLPQEGASQHQLVQNRSGGPVRVHRRLHAEGEGQIGISRVVQRGDHLRSSEAPIYVVGVKHKVYK